MDLKLFIIKHEHYRLAGLVRLVICEYKGPVASQIYRLYLP